MQQSITRARVARLFPAPCAAVLAVIAVVTPPLASPATAQTVSVPQELLTNGGFETGTFAGWTPVNRPLGAAYDPSFPAEGGFVVDNNADGLAPLSGLPTPGPAGGSFFALSDMTAQGTHALLQSFAVPSTATAVALTFNMYVYDWFGTGALVDPSGLDHTGAPNQHARVDLLAAGASPFDTGAGAVLANFYLGVDPEPQAGVAPVYRNYAIDLSGVVLPGRTYQLRFGAVDNQFVLNQALDNVSVRATLAPAAAAAVPEPGTWTLLLAAGAPLAGIRLRRGRTRR